METTDEKLGIANERRHAPRQLARKALLRVVGRRRLREQGERVDRVYLTFDDGPHPEHTPRLLDLLRQAQAQATFFVVGEACEQYPEILRRIVDEGHALGNHSYFHRSPDSVSAVELKDEVNWTRDAINQISGQDTCLFRPPYGALTFGKLIAMWRAGQQVVLWNVDPKDYMRPPAEVSQWFAAHPVQGRDIVLLHDVHDTAAAALPSVLQDMRRRGLLSAALPV